MRRKFETIGAGIGALLLGAVVSQQMNAAPPPAAARPMPADAFVSVPKGDGPALASAPVSAPQPAAAPPTPRAEALVVKRILEVPSPFRHGQWVWDEAGAPGDAPVVITVDLHAQVLSVWRGGYEIGAAAILYGADEKPTPLGVFPITEKDADHVSSLYDDAPMPWMLRLTNDGVAIHGSDVISGSATHGCIGVPDAFARKLFHTAKLGDKVIVTNGERLSLGAPIAAI